MKSEISFKAKPIHNPECNTVRNESIVEIIYPREGMKLIIPKEVDNQYEKVVIKAANKHQSNILWYINSTYYGKTERKHEIAVSLKSGTYKVSIIDEYGNTDESSFEVVK